MDVMVISRPGRFEEVAKGLRALMRSGELAPGDKLPSFPQMRAQGLSQHTVEKAYALLERDGLITRSNGNGVFVAQASSPSTKPCGALGFLTGDGFGSHPYWARLLEGVNSAARAHGFRVVLVNGDDPSAAWDQVDGVLGTGLGLPNILEQLPPEIPSVALLQRASEVAAVALDERQGIRDAMEHLLGLGHRRIGYLYAGYPDMRGETYLEALAGAGIEAQPDWLRIRHEAEALEFVEFGRQAMASWLQDGFAESGCTGLLCHNDEVALGAMQVLQQEGWSVPRDVSVVGFDGTIMCDLTAPTLTSVEVPLFQVGAMGVELFLQQLRREAGSPGMEKSMVVLPVSLRVRGSTSVPRL